MKVIYEVSYNMDEEEICLTNGNKAFHIANIAIKCGVLFTWIDICSEIPLDIATKIFQRWHQIDQSAEPEFIARALNDAVDDCLYVQVRVNDHRVNRIKMYDGEDAYIRLSICLGLTDKVIDSRLHMNDITINHNITEDRLEYFIDDKLKGWLPIIRKEITS